MCVLVYTLIIIKICYVTREKVRSIYNVHVVVSCFVVVEKYWLMVNVVVG